MPKHPVTCDSRAAEFRSEGFIVASSGGNLFCKYCNFCLDYKRKDSLQKHCKSQTHVARKSGNFTAARLATLEETVDNVWKVEDSKEEFILDTIEAFVDANIPIEKLDHPAIRAWLSKYVPASGDLPLANWLRQYYIPVVGEKKRQEIQADLKDSDIFLLCDEATDKSGNCVFNVLIRPSIVANYANAHLAESVVLDAANSANCANAVLDTLQKYSIDRQRVVGIVTDSARYMTKCVETVKELIDNVQHVQCWAHKASSIGSVFEDKLDELNTVVIKVKHAFLNIRKSNYIQFLSEKYQGSNPDLISLFPSPVCTRWNSWFKSVRYLSNHIEDVVEFFKSLEDGNTSVKFFNAASAATIQTIKVQAVYVSDICLPLMDLITFLEGSSYPTIHVLAGKLSDIEIKLGLLTEGVFSERTVHECQKLPSEANASVQAKLKTAAKSALETLQQLRSQDPAKGVVDSVGALFDPRNAPKKKSVPELAALQMSVPFIKYVQKLHFLEGHTAFLEAIKEQLKGEDCVSVDVQGILNGLKLSHREYACAALRAIWMPCSNAACERSFSKYSLVVSDRRRRLMAANAEALTMVAFEQEGSSENW
ncbi:phosphatidylinositol N-acetylglucosaminyltransferase subunit C isoform X2 [Tiliqua scincoides]